MEYATSLDWDGKKFSISMPKSLTIKNGVEEIVIQTVPESALYSIEVEGLKVKSLDDHF